MQAAVTTSDTAQQKRTLASRAAESLGLNSFRGRLLYVAALSICFMLITSWLAEKHVSEAARQGISDAAVQQETSRILHDTSNDIWAAEASMHHMPESGPARAAITLKHLKSALAKSAMLADITRKQRSPEVQQQAQEFIASLHRLHNEVAEAIASGPLATLHTRAEPFLERVRTSIFALERTLVVRTMEDMQLLAQAVDRQLQSLWTATLVGIVGIMASFFLFEYCIRRPVARITGALKAEAEGSQQIEVSHTWTQETANLVSAFDHMRRQVHARQQRLETILDNAAEGIITFDANGCIESFNKASEKLFGYTEAEVLGKELRLILPPQTRESREDYLKHFIRTEIQRLIGHESEVTGRHKDGTTFPMALKISAMMLQGKQLYTGLVADISERKAMLDNLKNMAEHDGLTGLYNRNYFQQELERVVERVKRAGGICCSLLYIDLDNFKYVNDTLGHAAGDRLIIEVASILNKRARKSDVIARIGGDEFTVLLFDTTPMLSTQVAESFRTRLADYIFRHSGEQIDIGCSIGVTGISPGTTSATEVLSQADLACHLAKRGGRNRVHLYNPDDAENVAAMSIDMGWSRRIKEAIEKDRFVLARQPIVNTATNDIDSYEVLIRMLDERNELIMPSGFLATADRFGLAAEIDKWVIRHAIEELARQRVNSPSLRYAINLSGHTLTTPGICELIQDELKDSGLDPSALTFEVTETVAIADMAAAENFLARLQSMGCRTALDDFGSGMASFAYLKDLPVNSAKIDGRFVKNLSASPVDQAMVKAMNEIAHALGKQTVAEFVENEESFKLLAAYGVDFAQGYHLGRPDVTLPSSSFTKGRCAS
ncbi:MAG: EAL domain-containing protein [Gammaproteobacteria bacterium]|nr:EAL domain-containing protein [Gammaproteobacteria bacterium]